MHWLSSHSHAALFDELSKIAEAKAEQGPSWKNRASTVAAGILGAGLGYGAVDLSIAKIPAVRRFLTGAGPNRAMAAKVILPIMGGASLMLADRYRKRMDEGLFGPKGPRKAGQT